ncbi:MAG: hydrogenase iron-sulfur subunit [Chloroflexi bacterium]|nr:hydrogenase iron-sulfur subunit [Chloroflexota bacterium]
MDSTQRVVIIGCARSAGVAVEELRASGRGLPANVEWVSMSCGGSIDELHILRAFESGADRVVVLACYDGSCRSMDGSQWAAKRVEAARALLEEAGVSGERVVFRNVAPTMAADLRQWVGELLAPMPTPAEG